MSVAVTSFASPPSTWELAAFQNPRLRARNPAGLCVHDCPLMQVNSVGGQAWTPPHDHELQRELQRVGVAHAGLKSSGGYAEPAGKIARELGLPVDSASWAAGQVAEQGNLSQGEPLPEYSLLGRVGGQLKSAAVRAAGLLGVAELT
jgi:hypothetical protein